MSSERIEPQRGDIIIVADRGGEFTGKPRPAVVVQSPHFVTATLTICPITSKEVDAPLLRIALPANEQTEMLKTLASVGTDVSAKNPTLAAAYETVRAAAQRALGPATQ